MLCILDGFWDQVGIVAWLANVLIYGIPDLIRDPLLWQRDLAALNVEAPVLVDSGSSPE